MTHEMIVVSWYVSVVVKMVSNADKSTEAALIRRIGSHMQPLDTPMCVAQYNANIQALIDSTNCGGGSR